MGLRLGGGEIVIRRALGTPAPVQGFRLFGSPLYGARLASPVAGTVRMRAGDGALSLQLVTGIDAALAATETGPDILAADAFIGYKVLAAMAAAESGPDIFAASAIIGTPPPPAAVDIYLIKLRSFTEHRRF